MRKHPTARLIIVAENDEPMLYCEIKEGKRWKRIARRAPGERWKNIEPGYAVSGCEPGCDCNHLAINITDLALAH